MPSKSTNAEPQQQQMMRALCCDHAPQLEELHSAVRYRTDVHAPVAIPPKGFVRVRVLAAGIAIDEVHAAEGTLFGRFGYWGSFSHKQPLVPGLECCGIIVALNEADAAVSNTFNVGDVVLGYINPLKVGYSTGTWAEFAVLPIQKLELKPTHLSPEQAVASFMSGLVAVAAIQKVKPTLDTTTAKSVTADDKISDTKSASDLKSALLQVSSGAAETSVNKATVVVCGATGSIGTLCMEAIKHIWPNSERVAICSRKSTPVALTSGATRVVAYDQVPEWGIPLTKQADVVIDLVGGSVPETQGGMALRDGGIFLTMVGPQALLGDKKLSWWAFIALVAKIAFKMLSNPFRRYTYTMADLSMAKMEFWRTLQEAQVFHPIVEKVVEMDNQDAVVQAILGVTAHHSKGKVLIHVADGDNKDMQQ